MARCQTPPYSLPPVVDKQFSQADEHRGFYCFTLFSENPPPHTHTQKKHVILTFAVSDGFANITYRTQDCGVSVGRKPPPVLTCRIGSRFGEHWSLGGNVTG